MTTTQTLKAPAAPHQHRRPTTRAATRIIPASMAASTALGIVGTSALDLDRRFTGLDPAAIALTTGIALTLGAVVLAALNRFTTRAAELFRRAAVAVTTLSLIGPITVLGSQPPDGPAHSRPQTTLLLSSFHLTAGAGAVLMSRWVEQSTHRRRPRP